MTQLFCSSYVGVFIYIKKKKKQMLCFIIAIIRTHQNIGIFQNYPNDWYTIGVLHPNDEPNHIPMMIPSAM